MNMEKDTLSEIRLGMETLKSSLPDSGLISDKDIREVMKKKSNWLNKLVYGEIIAIPIMALIMIPFGVINGMSLWCIYAILVACIIDVFLDLRTLRVSKDWIETESLIGLSKKLMQQKLERKRQLLIETPFVIVWAIWFLYEYFKHLELEIPENVFYWILGITSGALLIITFAIVIYVYKKAQTTNDNMIKEIASYED